MKMINVAGLAAASLAFAASFNPVSAADLGNYRGGSIKDDGYAAPVMQSAAGPCYFRGDLGYSASRSPKATWPVTNETQDFANPSGSPLGYTSTFAYAGDTVTDTSLGNSFFGGVGLGCGSGSRGIRGEVMLNQTGSRNFTGTPLNYTITQINTVGAPTNTDVVDPMHSSIKSTTLMFNGYKDLGNFGRVTPYIGAGVGVAYNKMTDVSFTGNPLLTNQIQGDSRISLAWSLMAGVGVQLTERAILDVGYRYMDYGKAQSGQVDNLGNVNPVVRVSDIAAHEFKVGLRYHFGAVEAQSYQPMK